MKVFNLTLLLMLISSCGGEIIDPNQNSEKNPQEVTLVRQQQLTKRYDCYGNLISSKLETINSVSKKYEIKPKEIENVWSFNASNGSEIRGSLTNNTGVFTIDMAPTLLNIRVYSGMNEIRYEFRYCDDQRQRTIQNGDGTSRTETYCANIPTTKEHGSIFINVTYKVEIIPGNRQIRRSAEACRNP